MATDIQPPLEPTTRRFRAAIGRRSPLAVAVAFGVVLLAAAVIIAAVVAGGDPVATQPQPVVAPAEVTAGGDDRNPAFDHEHQHLRDRVDTDSAADRGAELDREVQRFRNAFDVDRP